MVTAVKETVTIINRSGKIVSSSKHLVNIFNEAKSAYNERKAELKAFRRDQQALSQDGRRTHRRLEALSIADDDDTRSHRSSRRGGSRRGSDDGGSKTDRRTASRRERPPLQRGVSDSFYANDHRPALSATTHSPPAPPTTIRRSSLHTESRYDDDAPAMGLARRHTDGFAMQPLSNHRSRSVIARRASLDDIDMDLAYGELPPPLPARRLNDELELRQKMTGLQRLLDECNCLQHSVTAIIDNLQKNPDALAAVALTLAEISNLATKLAPGALATLKGSFPAVIALLASPEFAIAAGVGVGVTIIALGGYKIVKKIQAKRDQFLLDGAPSNSLPQLEGRSPIPPPPLGVNAPSSGSIPVAQDEAEEELRELSRIEVWRRGIAEAEVDSLGSSVEGELITPIASRTLIEEGKLTEADFKSRGGSDAGSKKKKHHSSSSSHREKERKAKSSTGSARGGKNGSTKEGGKGRSAKKEPSGLRMLFKKAA